MTDEITKLKERIAELEGEARFKAKLGRQPKPINRCQGCAKESAKPLSECGGWLMCPNCIDKRTGATK